jgi:hypothetical protein
MLDKRLKLQELLETVLGSTNVYFQPPPNITMKYPAIKYGLDDVINLSANNKVYAQSHIYEITIMDYDPDSVITDTISQLPRCKFVTKFSKDNLNHTMFTLTI